MDPRRSNAVHHSRPGEEQAQPQQGQERQIARRARNSRRRATCFAYGMRCDDRGRRRKSCHLRPRYGGHGGEAHEERDEKKWSSARHDDPLPRKEALAEPTTFVRLKGGIRGLRVAWRCAAATRGAPSRHRGARANNGHFVWSRGGHAATTSAPIFPSATCASLSTTHLVSEFCLVKPQATTRD